MTREEDFSDLQDQPGDTYTSDLGVQSPALYRLENLKLKNGYCFPYAQISYLTLGKLSADRDNAILICHALSGNAQVAGLDPVTGRPGWWDYHVGPGKTIDTNRFFVIATNVLGGCNGSTGPASVDPLTGNRYAMKFPTVTIEDMVRAQVALVDFLGIDRLFAVVGGSMGGMQALTWALYYPERVRTCIPLATCIAHSAMQIAFNEIGRRAITSDPNWQQGNYYESQRPEHGLAVARMVGHVTYLSEFAMKTKFGRNLQREAQADDMFPMFFSVESYLQHQGESFVRRFDPNSYLYITKALDMFDFLNGRDALASIQARFLVVSFASDWLYPPDQSRDLVRVLKRQNVAVTYCNLDTPYGHDSFLIRNPEFSRILSNFLLNEYENQKLKAVN